MTDEIEQIRARSADHMASVPNTHDRAQLDIATLLAHIDSLGAVLTPEVLEEMQIMTRKIWPTEPACTFKLGRLYEIEELLHD